MNKTEFIEQLKKALTGLSEEDIRKSTDYYEEMIEDRMEDGISEEEAVNGLGSIESIRSSLIFSLASRGISEKVTPPSLNTS